MAERLWRVRADVTIHGEWYVYAGSAELARAAFDTQLDEEPENVLRVPDFTIIEPIVETDEDGEPLPETHVLGSEAADHG